MADTVSDAAEPIQLLIQFDKAIEYAVKYAMSSELMIAHGCRDVRSRIVRAPIRLELAQDVGEVKVGGEFLKRGWSMADPHLESIHKPDDLYDIANGEAERHACLK